MGINRKHNKCNENIYVCEHRKYRYTGEDPYVPVKHGYFWCELLECKCKDDSSPKIKLSEE